MTIKFTFIFIFGAIFLLSPAEPTFFKKRARFPSFGGDKITFPTSVQQQVTSYAPAGFRPEPAFELPESTYLPPTEGGWGGVSYDPPEIVYEPPEDIYGPPEPELAYGPPPANTYGPPDLTYGPPEANNIQSTAVINAPLQLPTQLTPPRPNKAGNFRPQSAAIVNDPLRPVSHLTLPYSERFVDFRPRRTQNQAQQLYPTTYLTLPYEERLIAFRPRRFPIRKQQQKPNRFSRPLPTNIFGNSNVRRSSRPLSSHIFPK